MAARSAFAYALPATGTAIAPRHLGGDTTFVQENQPRRIDLVRLFAPEAALEASGGSILLGSVE